MGTVPIFPGDPKIGTVPIFPSRFGHGKKIGTVPIFSSHEAERGYVLLGIAVGLVILGIFMGAAVPVWQHVMQREKEKELIWRGNQYVQAIQRYQRKFPGAFPPNIEILVQQKFLRKAYKDPMTEDGEWRVLRQLSPEVQQQLGPQAPQGGPAGGLPGNRAGGPGQAQGGPGSSQLGRPSPFSRFRRGPGGAADDQALGGIVGVASKSEEESIRLWNGKEHYNEWLFVYTAQTNQPNAPGPPNAPGVPGAGQPGGANQGPGMFGGGRQRPPGGAMGGPPEEGQGGQGFGSRRPQPQQRP